MSIDLGKYLRPVFYGCITAIVVTGLLSFLYFAL